MGVNGAGATEKMAANGRPPGAIGAGCLDLSVVGGIKRRRLAAGPGPGLGALAL